MEGGEIFGGPFWGPGGPRTVFRACRNGVVSNERFLGTVDPRQFCGCAQTHSDISPIAECGKFRAFARLSRARKGAFARLRALRAPRFFRALARLRTRRPGYRTKASPASGSPFFFLLFFLLSRFLNPWLSERIFRTKKKCLRNSQDLQESRCMEEGARNRGSRAS